MALTPDELVLVAEITYETYERVEDLAVALNAAQETALSEDLIIWETIRDSHVKLSGEVDFDNERKREAIRRRVRKMLGLPLWSSEIAGSRGDVFAGGLSKTDMESRTLNSDRSDSFFTSGLHQSR